MGIDIEDAGSPQRKTQGEAGNSSASGSATESSSGDRKKRVSVTPSDPEKLEEVAEELGLPKSKVYNMAFQALLKKLGLE